MHLQTVYGALESSLWSAALLFVPALSHAAKDFVMPSPQPAKTYPAHDEHSSEGLTVGLDPYDTEEKAKIFTVNYSQYGIPPIFVIVTNDGDQPVALSGMKAEFVTGDRTKLSPSSEDDIYRRLNHPKASATNRYPLPFPSKKVKGAVGERRWQRFKAHNSAPRRSNLTVRRQDFFSSMCPTFRLRWLGPTFI